MKFYLNIRTILVCLFFSLLLNLKKYEQDGGLYTVHASDIAEFIKSKKNVLYLLHDESEIDAEFMKTYKSIQFELERRNYPVAVAYSTEKQSLSLKKHWGVHHLPHIRLILEEGVYVDYRAKPTFKGITSWVMNFLDSRLTAIEVKGPKEQNLFKKEERAFYLRFPKEKQNLRKMMDNIQITSPDIKVFYCHEPDLDLFDLKSPKEIVIGFKRNFDEGDKFFSSNKKIDENVILNFFYHYRNPHLTHLTEKEFSMIKEDQLKVLILFEEDEKSNLLKTYRSLAKKLNKGLFFMHVYKKDMHFDELTQVANVQPDSLPQLRIVNHGKEHNQVIQIDIGTEDEMEKNLKKYILAESLKDFEEL